MAEVTKVLLFGDQTEDFVPKLKELLEMKDHPILTAFLEHSHFVVRAQMMQSLPPAEHKVSRTSELSQMLQKYIDGKLSPAFQTALSCITQIGYFMRDFHAIGKQYPQAHDSYVLGICTGALAAAAVSSSSSLSELLPIAVQTVLVAFRLGLCATEMRDRLENSTEDRNKPWSVVVNTSAERAAAVIAEFCRTNILPKTGHPWITATSGGSTTVSGAPRVLTKLLAMPSFVKLKTRSIPIHVPAHNADLFSVRDVESILATTNDSPWSSYEAKLPFISSVTGKLVWAGSYKAQMELSLRQILLEPIGWDNVEEKLPRLLTSRGCGHVRIVPVTTNAHRALSTALSKTISSVEVESSVSSSESMNFSHRPGTYKAKLAIVSCSGRFPEAQSTEAFWKLLYEGLDVCKEVPERRWPISTHVDPTGKARNKGATKWGCWLDFYAQFDPRFFSISPKEAPQMDPAQRMALMSTYEAMERGGIVPDTTSSTQRNRIGVFHGVTSNDWMETNTAQNIDTYFITGGNRGFIPGRINFCFEFSGPSYTNDTACSSSLAAIHLACNSLWRGDCDTAVAGGTNMIFTPDGHAGLDKGFFLSRTGNCKAFDDNADGYCRAEGVGTVFIKRLEDALADNDPILATILDTKTNHSAMSESMTRPFAAAQIDNMNATMNTAGVDPRTLSYIEMHGTGTQVGDAEEMKSVLSCFAPNEATRSKDNPLFVGSAKANVGHGEGVSGVTSLIKVLLMMQNDTIPPHCGIKPGSKINRTYPDLAARNVHIAFKPTNWPRDETARRALINNFSAAGGNTALLLEDAPRRFLSTESDPRTGHIVTVSGHVGKSLRSNLELLLSHLQKQKVSLPHLSYTTTARRYHHLHRVSVAGSTVDEVKSKLETAIQNGDGINRPKFKSNVVFAFTGQGSQYLGMGKQLYDAYPSFHGDIQRFNRLAQSQGFPSFVHVFTATEANLEDFLPAVVQLAITCLQMALADLMQSFGIRPSAVCGHSLGEYAALYTAGVLSASDTIYLVGKRALLLQERCQRGSHSMLATKASPETLAKLAQDRKCEVACINGPEDTVLSGSVETIASVQRDVAEEGIKSTLLKLPFAFHSAQVQPILEDFVEQACGATFKRPQVPIISPLTKTVIDEDGILGPAYLGRHCRETVDMNGALQFAYKKGVIDETSVTVEIGPKPLLCGMIKMTLGTQMVTLPILTQRGDVWQNLQTIFSTLFSGGLDINWVAYHQPFDSTKNVIDLPSYGWDLQDHYIPYEGDWCLHRHKIHCDCAEGDHQWQTSQYKPGKHSFESNVVVPGGVAAHQPPAQTPIKVIKPSKQDASKESYPEIQSTTTVHRVVEEKTEPLGATLVVETDISRKDVNSIAQGHRVDGIPLCTPSFYADIALQVGRYSMNRIRAGHHGAIDGLVDVADLVVDKALIPHGQAPQLLRTTLTMSWPPKAAATTRSAKIRFATYFAHGKLDTEHATCTVRFTTDAQLKSIQKQVPEYKAQIARLREGIKKGDYVKYTRKSGYKLMGQMAHFHPDYKLLDNLVLNEADNEATSIMDFSTASDGGTYAAHPAYVDSITQVGGFAMNAKDDTDISQQVFVNHGWESFQIYQPLVKNKAYEVFTKMYKDKSGDMVHGDTIVLDGDEVAAFFRGLSLRCVPRKGLRAVLQSALDKGNRQRGGKPTPKQTHGATAPAQKPQAALTPMHEKPTATVVPVMLPNSPGQDSAKSVGAGNDKIKSALNLISEESGIALEELTDDSSFIDMGVDSLSSMVIGSRLREDLDLDLDHDFSLFVSCPTVRSLKDLIGGSEDAAGCTTDAPKPTTEPEAYMSPKAVSVAQESTDYHKGDAAAPSLACVAAAGECKLDKTALSDALKIVAEESGVSGEDFTQDTHFGDVGIDSLSSMVISSRFREELGLDLDNEFNLFAEVPTVADLATFLAGHGVGRGDTPSEGSGTADSGSSKDEGNGSSDTTETEPDEIADTMTDPYCRPCSSVILQGMPKVVSKILFMLPDGGGSASSYAAIPRLKTDAAIIGLNCPYARDPEEMRCTWQAYIGSYVNEIQRRQPKGPYHLGGWSSGGAFAFVTAEALVNKGEEVHSLIIIDAPVPAVMEKLPYEFYEHCNKVGLFANHPGGTTNGAAPPPPYLIPHFQKTVDVMLDYKVAPLKTSRQPKIGLVWAAETVLDEKDAPTTKGMHFMIKQRTDFGPDGWDTVCPGAEFDIVKVEGGNHFTLMSKSHVHLVSDLIDRVIA